MERKKRMERKTVRHIDKQIDRKESKKKKHTPNDSHGQEKKWRIIKNE